MKKIFVAIGSFIVRLFFVSEETFTDKKTTDRQDE